MSAEAITIISGLVLLFVFALVGWNLRRNRAHNDQMAGKRPSHAASSVAPGMGRRLKIALLMVAVIAAFFLLREHWDHVAGSWLYLLLLACPLMHLFHGQGGHGGHDKPVDKPAPGQRT